MLSMAMWTVLAVAPVQAVIGDLHGINTLEHQPQKAAAMEGHWETRLAKRQARKLRSGRKRRARPRRRCRAVRSFRALRGVMARR